MYRDTLVGFLVWGGIPLVVIVFPYYRRERIRHTL